MPKRKRKRGVFKKEFKKQLKFGLSAAIGFLIAYAWRQPLLRLFNDLTIKLVNNTLNYQAEILAALIITILGVIIFLLMIKYLR